MKVTLNFILLLFLITQSGLKCEKEDAVKEKILPEETQKGNGTFGCLVNGRVWLPKASFPYTSLTASVENDILQIWADSLTISTFSIVIRDLKSEGEYLIPNRTDSAKVKVSFDVDEVGTYVAQEGKITITKYDRYNQIIAGRFWFNGKTSGGRTVIVTEGRFDLRRTN